MNFGQVFNACRYHLILNLAPRCMHNAFPYLNFNFFIFILFQSDSGLISFLSLIAEGKEQDFSWRFELDSLIGLLSFWYLLKTILKMMNEMIFPIELRPNGNGNENFQNSQFFGFNYTNDIKSIAKNIKQHIKWKIHFNVI